MSLSSPQPVAQYKAEQSEQDRAHDALSGRDEGDYLARGIAWCMDQGCRRINPNSVRGHAIRA